MAGRDGAEGFRGHQPGLLLQLAVQEGGLDVQLPDLQIVLVGVRKERSDGGVP